MLLETLAKIADTDDFKLLRLFVMTDILDGATSQKTIEFLTGLGISESDIMRALVAVLVSGQDVQFGHGWN